jgi:hypothetical protein
MTHDTDNMRGGIVTRHVPDYCDHRWIESRDGHYVVYEDAGWVTRYSYDPDAPILRAAGTLEHCDRYVRCVRCIATAAVRHRRV